MLVGKRYPAHNREWQDEKGVCGRIPEHLGSLLPDGSIAVKRLVIDWVWSRLRNPVPFVGSEAFAAEDYVSSKEEEERDVHEEIAEAGKPEPSGSNVKLFEVG